PESPEVVTASDLRAALLAELPDAMVPALFTFLKALPLNANGKLDRKALPPPDAGRAGSAGSAGRATERVAPRNALEETVAELWREILGLPEVGVHDDFFALGGHSLTATRLLYGLRHACGVELPLRLLFRQPTIAALAAAIAAMSAISEMPASRPGEEEPAGLPVMTVAALAAEAVLAPEIRPSPEPSAGLPPAPRFLLTGATGFLGAFLLAELLRQVPEARVLCLVRGERGEGERRLRERLAAFGLWEEPFAGRFEVVPGDLARPRLGLAAETFSRLAREVDAVYHNGAFVNLFHPYATLRPANVLGTHEVLRLAAEGRPKPVHHVSTVSVFASAGGPPLDVVDEGTDLGVIHGLVGGYGQSKWVAEKLVHLGAERGLPATVYRPGRIGGHSATGLGNADDLLFRILRGSFQLGAIPEMELEVEVSPVDYVSRALVHLSLQSGGSGRVYHLVNPRPIAWSALLDLLATLGAPLRRLPLPDWQAELRRAARRSSDNALYPLLPLLAAEPDTDRGGREEPAVSQPFVRSSATTAALAGSGIDCPPVDARLLGLYLSHLIPNFSLRKENP
ncbi:MAG TPA: thioester reductase domain-containing protein, partial [Thermoanaerobaculia bacterium]|nr:thioester reductase domain-containing protein [Thermoanaerobaculia bacterium]